MEKKQEYQQQLNMLIATAKEAQIARLFGACVAGYLISLQKPELKIHLHNFGALAFLSCPAEALEEIDGPWSDTFSCVHIQIIFAFLWM